MLCLEYWSISLLQSCRPGRQSRTVKTTIGHVDAYHIDIQNIISRDVLFCACHYSNVKARFLHKEETLACGLSLYHWCVRYHQDNSLYSLDIDKSECQITLILTRPQSLD